jgi:glycosyltransferase involved in cell wall biosynthesis
MKNRVLFILHLPPPIHGAAVVGQQIKESKYINNTLNCRYINLGISTSIDDIGKTNIRKFRQYFSVLWQLFVQLLLFRPKLCYLTITSKGSGFYKDFPMVLLVKLFNRKIVYHFHNKGVIDRQNKVIDNILYRIIFKNADVILLSKYLYPDIRKYVPETKVHYCPNGIPQLVSDFNHKNLCSLNEKVEILFLSNLIESKGIFILLEACEILFKKEIPFNCTFAGNDEMISSAYFQKKINEKGLAGSVNYVGAKYGSEKEVLFKQSDIFAFPTYYHNECFPLVLIEAMQYRLPIITTHEGGIPDVVEDGITGYLVQQKNVEALAEKIEKLINIPELRKQMGVSGRAKYEKEFTLNIFENKLQTILNHIICENN